MKSLVQIVKHKNYDFEKVRFYTLKFEGDKQNQLDQFFSKYEKDYEESTQYIQWWLAKIGETRGAKPRYFRKSDNVSYLPPPIDSIKIFHTEVESNKMNLRLYSIVLSEEVVILVNGGIKESQKLQDSPKCWKQYLFTSNIASQISQQSKLGNWKLNGKQFIMKKTFSLTYDKAD